MKTKEQKIDLLQVMQDKLMDNVIYGINESMFSWQSPKYWFEDKYLFRLPIPHLTRYVGEYDEVIYGVYFTFKDLVRIKHIRHKNKNYVKRSSKPISFSRYSGMGVSKLAYHDKTNVTDK